MDNKLLGRGFIVFFQLGLAVILLSGCSQEGRLDDFAKSLIFTDRRGYDQEIINEDISLLSQAIKREPNSGKLYLSRGFVYATIHEYSKAIEDFTKASLLEAPSVGAYNAPARNGATYWLGLAYWQRGDRQEGLKYLSKTIEDNPDHALSYFYRGMIKWQIKDKTGAIKDMETAVQYSMSGDNMRMYQCVLEEMRGVNNSGEKIACTFVICFLSNNPPQSRPFGYVWQITHEVS